MNIKITARRRAAWCSDCGARLRGIKLSVDFTPAERRRMFKKPFVFCRVKVAPVLQAKWAPTKNKNFKRETRSTEISRNYK